MKQSRFALSALQIALLSVAAIMLQGLAMVFPALPAWVTTGLVHAVIALAVLRLGLPAGLVVGVCAAVAAYFEFLLPAPVAIPMMMVGYCAFSAGLALCISRSAGVWRHVSAGLGLLAASLLEGFVLYMLIVQWAYPAQLAPGFTAGFVNQFSWPHLAACLVGGVVGWLACLALNRSTPQPPQQSQPPEA